MTDDLYVTQARSTTDESSSTLAVAVMTRHRSKLVLETIAKLAAFSSQSDLYFSRIQIYVSDSSNDDVTEHTLRPLLDQHNNVTYRKATASFQAAEEHLFDLLSVVHEDFVWTLSDDDIPHPECFVEIFNLLDSQRLDLLMLIPRMVSFDETKVIRERAVEENSVTTGLRGEQVVPYRSIVSELGLTHMTCLCSAIIARTSVWMSADWKVYLRISPIYAHSFALLESFADRPTVLSFRDVFDYRLGNPSTDNIIIFRNLAARLGRSSNYFWCCSIAQFVVILVKKGILSWTGFEEIYERHWDGRRYTLLNIIYDHLYIQIGWEIRKAVDITPLSADEIDGLDEMAKALSVDASSAMLRITEFARNRHEHEAAALASFNARRSRRSTANDGPLPGTPGVHDLLGERAALRGTGSALATGDLILSLIKRLAVFPASVGARLRRNFRGAKVEALVLRRLESIWREGNFVFWARRLMGGVQVLPVMAVGDRGAARDSFVEALPSTTGHACYGPYWPLPTGRYRFEVEVEVSHQSSQVSFELKYGDILVACQTGRAEPGISRLDMDFCLEAVDSGFFGQSRFEFRIFNRYHTSFVVRSCSLRLVSRNVGPFRSSWLDHFSLGPGVVREQGWVTIPGDQAGHGLYGPYVALLPGHHSFVTTCRCVEETDIVVDVLSAGTEVIRREFRLPAGEHDINLDVSLPHASSDFGLSTGVEVRLAVRGREPIQVSRVECVRTPGRPSTSILDRPEGSRPT